MEEVPLHDLKFSNSNIRSVARKLVLFSSSLQTREKQILYSLISERMDPLDRMKWADIRQLLTSNEINILNIILAEESR